MIIKDHVHIWYCVAEGKLPFRVAFVLQIYRGSFMSAHVLLNLLNKLGKRGKMRGLLRI